MTTRHSKPGRSGAYIGIALASILHIFNPARVVIGGGVSQSGEFLMARCARLLKSTSWPPNTWKTWTVSRALFGDEAGLTGALSLARDLIPGISPCLNILNAGRIASRHPRRGQAGAPATIHPF